MKLNKLKVISIAVCCFVASLWSETQGMELESATMKDSMIMKLSAQDEINDFTPEPISSKLVNLADSQTSWAADMYSPLRTTIWIAHEVMKYTMRYPQHVMFLMSILVTQTEAACSTSCFCYCKHMPSGTVLPAGVTDYPCPAWPDPCGDVCTRIRGGQWKSEGCYYEPFAVFGGSEH